MDEQQTEQFLDSEDMQDAADLSGDQQDSYDQARWEEHAEAQVPFQKRPESLFGLFTKVWKAPDSSKVANLDKWEMGKISMSVRDAQYLSLLGSTLHHPGFSGFFRNVGEITLKTSASKKGWFTELFVSQKKFTARTAQTAASPQEEKKKWSLLGSKNNQEQSSEQQ